ncbi:hypothetical protein IJJ53_01015 [Candidatus Saccharibacteria bacterium]|nr:hypothetical protein [Candidatus Saccharibacteria bacterium]
MNTRKKVDMKVRTRMRKVSCTLLLVSLLMICATAITHGAANALSDNAIDNKFYARGLKKCYMDGYMSNSVNIKNATSVAKKGENGKKIVGIPSFSSPDDINCHSLLNKLGYGTSSKKADFYTKLGYNPEVNSYSTVFKFGSIKNKLNAGEDLSYSTHGFVEGPTIEIKTTVSSDGTVSSVESKKIMTQNGKDLCAKMINNNKTYRFYSSSFGTNACDVELFSVSYDGKTNEKFISDLEDTIKTCFSIFDSNKKTFKGPEHGGMESCGGGTGASVYSGTGLGEGVGIYYAGRDDITESKSDNPTVFSLNKDKYAAFKTAYKNIFGKKYTSDSKISLTSEQKAVLYQNYLTNYYNAEIDDSCASTKDKAGYGSGLVLGGKDSKFNEWHIVKLFKTSGKAEYCYVKFGDSVLDKTVHGAKKDDSHGGKIFRYPMMAGERIGLADIIKWMNDSSPDKVSKGAVKAYATSIHKNKEEGGEDAEKDPCYNSGIESMSWIICPAIENTSQTVGALEGTLRDWLQIKTNDTFKKQTYTAWNVFRNIANVILVIVFLAIIFSQLTGFGIDNYGIKKMLPRLIAMAILINLSYVICEIAVDLSNILGVGLSDMFKNIGYTINNNGGADLTAQTIVAIVLGLIAAGGTVAGIAIASGGGIMIVVSLLLALLVALVAVLMFFVMLSARMIIVIIFTILSPVAFALYVLPNTQNLFKKWWKVFQAALIVFPICGALYGGSVIIKAIVINGDGTKIDFIPGLIAVVAPFLPFLLLPTLLKSALAGLGALGGTLTMLGNGLKKGASSGKGAIENTKAYKGAQERAADRSAERRATRIRDRLQRANIRNGGTADNLSGLSASQRRRLFQAQTTLNERNQQRAQDDVGAFDNSEVALSRAEAARDATEYKAFQDQFADPNADLTTEAGTAATWYNPNDRRSQQRMRALIGAMESKGMEQRIFSMLESNPGVGTDRVAMDALASSNNKVLKAYGKKGSGMSYRQFMSGGGMQQYVSNKGTDFLNGLDDKALSEINKYSSSSNQIMSNDLLVSAAAQINSQDAANEVEAMLNKRSGFEFSGEQLAQFNASTISRFASRGAQDVNMYNALVDASNAIASDPKLLNGLSAPKRQEINKFRASAGLPPI